MSKPNFPLVLLISLLLVSCGESVEQKVDPVKSKNELSAPNASTMEETATAIIPEKKAVIETLLSDEEYMIDVKVEELGPTKVRFTTSTNLPLPVQVMAGVSLQGQNPDDTWIGFNERVTLKNKDQTFTLSFPQKPLPKGQFDAEVAFYPRWGAKDGNPVAAKIGSNIEGASEINLSGDGQNAEDRMARNKMQLWIMENVNPATPYVDSEMRAQLGSSEPVAVTRMNPKIIKGHYFPKANMTIYVNVLKSEYVTFRKGRDTNGM